MGTLAGIASGLALSGFVCACQLELAHSLELDAKFQYGFTVKTQQQDPALADDELFIRYSGPVAFPLS